MKSGLLYKQLDLVKPLSYGAAGEILPLLLQVAHDAVFLLGWRQEQGLRGRLHLG